MGGLGGGGVWKRVVSRLLRFVLLSLVSSGFVLFFLRWRFPYIHFASPLVTQLLFVSLSLYVVI